MERVKVALVKIRVSSRAERIFPNFSMRFYYVSHLTSRLLSEHTLYMYLSIKIVEKTTHLTRNLYCTGKFTAVRLRTAAGITVGTFPGENFEALKVRNKRIHHKTARSRRITVSCCSTEPVISETS